MKLTLVQRKALKGSIRKWTRIVNGTGVDHGPENCPLCKLYWFDNPNGRCVGCPVVTTTGKRMCEGTPYDNYDDTWSAEDDTQYRLVVAKAELAFLKAILKWGS